MYKDDGCFWEFMVILVLSVLTYYVIIPKVIIKTNIDIKLIKAELGSMQKENTLLSVTTGKNTGYYELYDKKGETVARTFNGDTTKIYKAGKVWLFREQGVDGEVNISNENELPTLALLCGILNDDDIKKDITRDKDGEILCTLVTNKIPTQDKLLSGFILNNIKEFTGLRIEYKNKPTLQISIEIESEGNKRTPYCTFIGYQKLNDWELDKVWNWNEQLDIKDTENLIALRDRELSKLQQNIQGYMREKNENKLKSRKNTSGEEYAKATDERKQEYIDKALNEVVNGLNVPFIGDRVSLKKEVDSYYQKNGNVPNLIEVVQYICYTKGLFAPYEYALANDVKYTTQYQQW